MKIASRIFLVGILILGATLTAYEIDRPRYVYPTPETQSAFLKSYTATPVVDRFKAKQGFSSQRSADSAAGRKFVTHHSEEEQYFVIESELKPTLIAAMNDDIAKKLVRQGAQIVGQTDSQSGFEVRYELGKSKGVVALDPLQNVDPRIVMGSIPVPTGNEALILRVRIAETWSKLDPERRTDWPTLRSPSNTVQIR
jgi:hypothetical protein